MISYMSGPMLGNLEAGIVASIFTVETSIISGGFICIFAVMAVHGSYRNFGILNVKNDWNHPLENKI